MFQACDVRVCVFENECAIEKAIRSVRNTERAREREMG